MVKLGPLWLVCLASCFSNCFKNDTKHAIKTQLVHFSTLLEHVIQLDLIIILYLLSLQCINPFRAVPDPWTNHHFFFLKLYDFRYSLLYDSPSLSSELGSINMLMSPTHISASQHLHKTGCSSAYWYYFFLSLYGHRLLLNNVCTVGGEENQIVV